jgi:hypothetical protein
MLLKYYNVKAGHALTIHNGLPTNVRRLKPTVPLRGNSASQQHTSAQPTTSHALTDNQT